MARILLVDDNLMIRSVIRTTLMRAGHDVGLAEDGVKALAEVEASGPFDLIITDLEMPRLDGRGLIRALRAASCTAPVLLMSGRHGIAELARIAADQGLSVQGAIEKPFTGERLIATVAAMLAVGAPARPPRQAHRPRPAIRAEGAERLESVGPL
jgi:CheY-like chemotaxis protein